jgi:pantoate--beta-alanine ligase
VPAIIDSVDQWEGICQAWDAAGETIALVPTMGALHAGHKALVRVAEQEADRVVVSIFVNPLQFGQGEDFETYPRTLEADEAYLADTTVDVIFAPGVAEMYPDGLDAATRIHAGPVGDVLEGQSRPGHFDGVLTVVHRLCELVRPSVAVFGEKDAQQLFLVRQMVREEKLPVRIVEVATVRDDDGLALSSRNAHLSPADRERAKLIPLAWEAAQNSGNLTDALVAVREVLSRDSAVSIDYVSSVDPDTFMPVNGGSVSRGRIVLAVEIGQTRLIDNRLLEFGQ